MLIQILLSLFLITAHAESSPTQMGYNARVYADKAQPNKLYFYPNGPDKEKVIVDASPFGENAKTVCQLLLKSGESPRFFGQLNKQILSLKPKFSINGSEWHSSVTIYFPDGQELMLHSFDKKADEWTTYLVEEASGHTYFMKNNNFWLTGPVAANTDYYFKAFNEIESMESKTAQPPMLKRRFTVNGKLSGGIFDAEVIRSPLNYDRITGTTKANQDFVQIVGTLEKQGDHYVVRSKSGLTYQVNLVVADLPEIYNLKEGTQVPFETLLGQHVRAQGVEANSHILDIYTGTPQITFVHKAK